MIKDESPFPRTLRVERVGTCARRVLKIAVAGAGTEDCADDRLTAREVAGEELGTHDQALHAITPSSTQTSAASTTKRGVRP